MPAPSIRHRVIGLKMAAALLQYVEARKLGRVLQAPCDVVLSQKIVIQPDILFVKKERRGLFSDMYLRGAPDLVVEISQLAWEKDLKTERRICGDFGIPEYWTVDLDACRVETLVWSELGYVSVGKYHRSQRLSSPLLSGLNLPLTRIFGSDD